MTAYSCKAFPTGYTHCPCWIDNQMYTGRGIQDASIQFESLSGSLKDSSPWEVSTCSVTPGHDYDTIAVDHQGIVYAAGVLR